MSGSANLQPAIAGRPGPALRHGAYSLIKLAPRAQTIRAELEERLPLRSDADEATLDLAALVLAQVERAAIVLSAVQAEESATIADGRKLSRDSSATLQRLSADLRGWIGRAQQLLDDLGLSPHSRMRLGIAVVQQQTAIEALDEHLRRKRNDGG